MYTGLLECARKEDCNIKRYYIFDASFIEQDVINMMLSKYKKERCVEIWKCEVVESNHKLDCTKF